MLNSGLGLAWNLRGLGSLPPVNKILEWPGTESILLKVCVANGVTAALLARTFLACSFKLAFIRTDDRRARARSGFS